MSKPRRDAIVRSGPLKGLVHSSRDKPMPIIGADSRSDWIETFAEHSWPETLIGVVEWLTTEHGYGVLSIDDKRIVFRRPGWPRIVNCWMARNGLISDAKLESES